MIPNFSTSAILEATSKISTLSTTDAREYLLESIDEARRYIIALSKCHNRLAKANQLPEEILSIMLVECTMTDDNVDKPFEVVSWAQRVAYSSVCAQWRGVALRCPSFWTGIGLQPNRHLAEMLQRSGQVPFPVRMDCSDWSHSRIGQFPLLFPDPARMTEVHMMFPDSEFTERLQNVVLSDFPIISSFPKLRSVVVHSTSQDMTILAPFSFTQTQAPLLVKLELIDCNLFWEGVDDEGPCSFPGLREFIFKNPPIECTSQELLEFISTTPMLQRLVLEDAMPANSYHPPSASITEENPLVLGHLEYISVSDTLANCKDIIPCIQFDNAILRHFIIDVTRDDIVSDIPNTLSELVDGIFASTAPTRTGGKPFYHSLSLERTTGSHLSLSFPERGLRINIPCLLHDSQYFEAIQLPWIAQLTLEEDPESITGSVFPSPHYILDWFSFLAGNSTFKALKLCGVDAEQCISALGREPFTYISENLGILQSDSWYADFVRSVASSSQEPQILLPNLEAVTLSNVRLRRKGGYLERFISVLRDRCAAGCPISMIELEGIVGLDEEGYQELRSALPADVEIKWNK